METIEITSKELRRRLSEVLGATEYGRKTYVVTKNGRPVAQIVPVAEETSTKRKQRA